MPLYDNRSGGGSIRDLVDQYAAKYGVPSWIVEDIVAVESSFNPNAEGDNGTSFGLLQLHWGGQGTGYTKEQLKDPNINLSIGMPYIAAGYRAALAQGYSGFDLLLHTAGESGHPGGSPGHYIMTSQYEALLRRVYTQGTGAFTGGGTGATTGGGGSGGSGGNVIGDGAYGLFTGIDNALQVKGFDLFNPLGSLFQSGQAIALRAFLFLLGLIIIIFGLILIVEEAGLRAPGMGGGEPAPAEGNGEDVA
jgi:hypothetical protein